MDSTTGGDANDEFARWLAETARAEQAAAQATPPAAPAQPLPPAPAAPPMAQPPVAQPPVAPPQFPPAAPAPEFFSPPAAPTYEQQLGGPQVARSSFQSAGSAPAGPAHGAPPAPVAPAAPAQPVAAPPTLPPTIAAAPALPPTAPAAPEPPSWAPGYTAPPVQQPAAPAYPAYAPEAAAPAAPAYPAPPAFPTVAPVEPQYTVPAAPAYVPPPAAPVAPPAAFDTFPPAAPSFPEAAPVAPPADPFGPLFTTDADTAARLAASPPPAAGPTPTLATPVAGVPADEDPMKALFGLQTEEQPSVPADSFIVAPEPVIATSAPQPPSYPAAPVAPAAPAYAEPSFAAPPVSPEPAAPAYVPEPAFAAAAAPAAAASPVAVPADDDPNAGTQFFGGGVGEWEEPPDLDRTTTFERIAFVVAFTGPIGLVMSIVAAARSSRVRGWVHKFVRASLVIGVIFTIAAGIGGAYAYKVFDDARQHDAIEAASTQFCQTMADNPDMLSQPTFGFPAPAASVPDTLAAIQEYVDRWEALAKVSPTGIRADVTKVADAARSIMDTITTTRLVNNDENVAVMTSIASQTNVIGWAEEYCG